MLRSLSAIGFDLRTFARVPARPPGDEAIEAPDLGVRHVVIDFVLRLVECGIFAHDADMVRAFIFTAIMAANADPYTEDATAAWDYATLAQSPPEERRRPVTVLEVSRRTGIPYETTRRYVQQMLRDRDIVKAVGKGFINPQVSPRDAKLHESGAMVLSRFAQLIGDLGRLGFSFESWRVEPRRNVA
jgi:hypothetical protein